MAEGRFDVLVIGGGITGVGVALDAAARGLSVALVEKDDFASGTSGRSSRMVHGGLRYLEQREFGLVRESLRERKTLLMLAPHLVRPAPMLIPVEGPPQRRAFYRAGLTAYDLLAVGCSIGGHRPASEEDIRKAVPGFGRSSRGYRYFECLTDDAKLTIEVARAAQAAGAVLANHARVDGLLGGARVTGAAVVDETTGERLEIRARATVNASGIWADRVWGLGAAGPGRLSPSKGVHLVFAPGTVRTNVPLILPSAAGDGRYVFVIPWEDRVYVGTTDTPYDGDLDDPAVTDSDREYIVAALARDFPDVSARDVVACWAGLRPLLKDDEDAADAATHDLSRRHAVFEDPPGLYTITGGKLTTYRSMAEGLVDRLAAALGSAALGSAALGSAAPCQTRRIPLGLHGSLAEASHLAKNEASRLGLPARAGARLVRRYGDDWREAIRMIGADPSLGEPAVPGLPVLGVELELARSREMALTEQDVYVRRTRLTTRDASVSLPPA
jgi:glycerol-3-phosphate dehydrogenase